jgi:PHD/YefM family antitoxin component YafN of YafNO toxin-antitoxin module
VITERGKPALVLMTYEDFTAHDAPQKTLLERIDVPGTELIELEPPLLQTGFRPADL